MDLYTLNSNFLDKDIVDEYVSAIWTERYSEVGEVQLVVPPTEENIIKLKEGTFLALRGSKEVMLLETQSIEKGLMTVVGKTLPIFLNNRASWFKNPEYTGLSTGERVVDYTDATKKPGEFIADVVYQTVINPTPFPNSTYDWTPANLDWDNDKIPFLTLGAVDSSGEVKRLTAPIGPLYEVIANLAKQDDVGISLYLESADPDTGYVLKFTTYRGVDRTSTGDPDNLVRLTRDLDGISDIKEVNSVSKYKNVAYVYYKGRITPHYADPSMPIPEGFDRRIMVVTPEGEPVGRKVDLSWGRGGTYTQYVVGALEEDAFREQNAKDALANNNYIHAIDGQTSPITDYRYGVDYGLGDTIELEGFTGNLTKAKITEYIRSEDATGEKGYPTITVVDGE